MDVIFDALNDHYVRSAPGNGGYKIAVHPRRLIEQAALLLNSALLIDNNTANRINTLPGVLRVTIEDQIYYVFDDGQVFRVKS